MSIFKKIIQRDLPAEIVQEDQLVISFMDLYPKSVGHTLVVPKLDKQYFDELPQNYLHRMIEVVSLLSKAQMKVLGNRDYNLVLNNGELAGQEVAHVHMHVIPRYQAGQEPKADLAELASMIRQALQQVVHRQA